MMEEVRHGLTSIPLDGLLWSRKKRIELTCLFDFRGCGLEQKKVR